MKSSKIALTYGSFDILHSGHIELFLNAISKGIKEIYVGLSTDEFASLKGKKHLLDYYTRKKHLEILKFITHIFPEHNWEQKEEDIRRINPAFTFFGSDWVDKDQMKSLPGVIFFPRTNYVCSSKIKNLI